MMASSTPFDLADDIERDIPSLILDLRGRLAQAQTDRNRFQRERDEARAALAISRKTVDDLTAHSVAQGEYIARLDIDVRVRDKALAEAERKLNRMRDRADKLAEYIEHDLEHHGEDASWPHVRELIEAAGIECVVCDGKGWVADEEFVGDPGAKFGYRTREVADKCAECDGLGKCLR